MATASFTYNNVISDDETAQKFLDALQKSAATPLPKSDLIPNVEESIARSREYLSQILSRSRT